MGEGGGDILVARIWSLLLCVYAFVEGRGGLFSKSIFLKAPNFPKDLLIDNERQRLEY